MIAADGISRRTFVISVRDQDGPATVEEVRTGRKARLGSLRDAVAQIERWLDEGIQSAAPIEPEEGR